MIIAHNVIYFIARLYSNLKDYGICRILLSHALFLFSLGPLLKNYLVTQLVNRKKIN